MKAKPATELILFLKITHTLKIVRGMSGKNLQKAKLGQLDVCQYIPRGGISRTLTGEVVPQ